MRIPKSVALVAIGMIVGCISTAGTTAVVSATGTSKTAPTWYGCLSAKGTLSKVGIVAPTCRSHRQAMSWNSYPASANGTPRCTGIPHSRIDLSGCELAGANLSAVGMPSAQFVETDLQYADLENANVANDNFTGANLSHARLVNLDGLAPPGPSDANFANATLTEANLANANLSGDNFTGANLTGVTWSNTLCPDGTNSDNVGDTCVGHLT